MTNELTTQESKRKLRSYIEMIEQHEERKADISGQIKEIFDDAKNYGFDPKIMKTVIKMRKMDESELEEQEILTDLYMEATNV